MAYKLGNKEPDDICKAIDRYVNKKIVSHTNLDSNNINYRYLPDEYCNGPAPAMLYPDIKERYIEMRSSEYKYNLDQHAFTNSRSSQTACVNLFMPVLESKSADNLLKKCGIAPLEFKNIERDRLFNGYCFEYHHGIYTWQDVAVAFRNENNELCLWFIEHKLLEERFTNCDNPYKGGYCLHLNAEEFQRLPDVRLCNKGRRMNDFWRLMESEKAKQLFAGLDLTQECPFYDGMYQLWRNQLSAIRVEKSNNEYKHVYCSVVYHPYNSFLNKTIESFKDLIHYSPMFSSFTSEQILDAARQYEDLQDWAKWYGEVYFGIL